MFAAADSNRFLMSKGMPSDGLDFDLPFGAPGTDDAGAEARPMKVSELTARLKLVMERNFAAVFVEGEVSNWRPAASGHAYFVLKDGAATINCVMWASEAARLAVSPKDGDTVELRGRLAIYEARGQYQIVVQSLRPAGLGKLFLAFQQLKERLQKEGLFETGRKRQIPRFPRAIGVVTSPTGAAVRDILKVLSRRAPHIPVYLYPARVQGEGAAAEIANAIARINALRVADVLIVGRGGGSIEDLWAFNEEAVARAIHASGIPVISAVGHEVDFTIADFVADLRAPTPSAGAELAAPDTAELLRMLDHMRMRVASAARRRCEFLSGASHLRVRMVGAVLRRFQQVDSAPHLRQRLVGAMRPRIEQMRSHVRAFDTNLAVARPLQRVNEFRQRLDDIGARRDRAFGEARLHARARLARLEAQLSALNPTSILQRGYSITIDPDTGRAVRRPVEVHGGQPLRILLHEGNIDVHVAGPAPAATRRRGRGGAQNAVEWFGEPVEEDAE